jgi:hypothetical protein
VTANKVLHVSSENIEDMKAWIAAVRDTISNSIMDYSDPLFQHALLKIDNDEFYTSTFTEKAPLGVVFERSGEWAIIKSSNKQNLTGIYVGSVLASVNGESVVLEEYQKTIERLRNWTPPLTLGFRRPPRKEAYLLKESKSKKNPSKRLWKKRFFILAEGKLGYKDAITDDALRVELPLMGSAVSLLTSSEAGGRDSCFRLMSGLASLIVQCANPKQVNRAVILLINQLTLA